MKNFQTLHIQGKNGEDIMECSLLDFLLCRWWWRNWSLKSSSHEFIYLFIRTIMCMPLIQTQKKEKKKKKTPYNMWIVIMSTIVKKLDLRSDWLLQDGVSCGSMCGRIALPWLQMRGWRRCL
jgi:hypothetical protein